MPGLRRRLRSDERVARTAAGGARCGWRMRRWLLATALLLASPALLACPLCLGAGRPSAAQQLADAEQVVLAVPTAQGGSLHVVAAIKGPVAPGTGIAGSDVRFGGVPSVGKPQLLARADASGTWAGLGAIGTEHVGWLRRLAAENRPAESRAEVPPPSFAPRLIVPRNTGPGQRQPEALAAAWQARIALVLPYLQHREPLAAEIAYSELASAPYTALRTARPQLAVARIREWVADPALTARQPLYLLLLGIAGNAGDAAMLERRLEAVWTARDATLLAPLIAADLELRGASRMVWVDEKYLRDPGRSTREIDAALLALSVHGQANAAIPRARVIESYRRFIQSNPPLAGLVAPDLAAWQYWDAVPEYLALLNSEVRQHYASRLAIVAYLQQSPDGTQAVRRVLAEWRAALPDGDAVRPESQTLRAPH